MQRDFFLGVAIVAVLTGCQSAHRSEHQPLPQTTRFPQEWAGTWHGTLTSTAYRVSGEKREDARELSIQMTLEIAPTSDPSRWSWTITYDGEAGKQVRPYELVIRDAAAVPVQPHAMSRSRFAIDEKNGIVIPVQFADNVLWSSFEVLGTRVDVREEFVQGVSRENSSARALDEIRIEMISTKVDDSEVSGGANGAVANEGNPESSRVPLVRSWSPISIQRGVLKRR